MTWVSWRLQRTETVIAATLLTLLAALFVPTGLNMASDYTHAGLAACAGKNTLACHEAASGFLNRFSAESSLLGWFNLLPGILGVLLAAPLLLDLETGTVRLAWTQSITRSRWLATRLAVTCTAALLAAGALTALVTWWRGPLDQLSGRMGPNVFDYEGIVSFGYVLFALGLALAIGATWRRTVPAVVVGFVGYTAARFLTQHWLRKHFVAPISSVVPATNPGPNLTGAWVLSGEPSDRFGHPASNSVSLFQTCSRAVGSISRTLDPACLARHGAGYNHIVYQPASRFWLLQGIETALFAGTALALIALAAWWIHQRIT
jgi:hypothetical protein